MSYSQIIDSARATAAALPPRVATQAVTRAAAATPLTDLLQTGASLDFPGSALERLDVALAAASRRTTGDRDNPLAVAESFLTGPICKLLPART